MDTKRSLLTIKNIIAYYEPFTIREVFHIKLNRVVHYAVFIDNDPLKIESGFDKILFTDADFEVSMETIEVNGELIRKRDLYFLTKLAMIIRKRLKSHECSLQNYKNILQEIIDKGDLENQALVENVVRKDILRMTKMIEFIKASEEKLKTNYTLYSYIKKLNGITY